LNARRVCGLLGAFAVMGLVMVHLRAAQTQSASRLLEMEARRIELRRELWSIQSRTARLRSPQRILDRAELVAAELLPPGPDVPLRGSAETIAQRR